MGTRGAYGFIKGGVEKVTYNHFDSYPSGLGKNILSDLAGVDIATLNSAFDRIELVSGEIPATEVQIEASKQFANEGVSTGELSEWYVLLRNAQGSLAVFWAANPLKYLIDSCNFLLDSLFCEYAYIVNLDSQVLEFYKGFCSRPVAGRYGKLKESESEYYGVRLVLEIPLADISSDTIEDCIAKMEADDDE